MNSNEPIFLPEQHNNNRQAWTCVAVAGLVGCVVVVIMGLMVLPLIPKDIIACADWLPQRSGVDGNGQIAFVSDRDGNPEIYVINTDGSGVTRLTKNPAGDYAPTWSPDGTRIAFYSERDGNAEIYVINADGSGLTRLTNDPANDYAPAWSPDGTRIAFHSHRYKGAGRIFVMNADGSGATRLTDPAWDDWAPAWSPDGKQIVFNSSRNNKRDIWLMNADGSKMTNLTRNPADDWWPDWSPDGTHIAFHSTRDGNFEIYTINTDSSGITRLTDHPAGDYDPVWSPDGMRIAFTSDRCGNRDIWIMKSDGSGITNLTRYPAHDWAPAWRPEERKPIAKFVEESKDAGVQQEEPALVIEASDPGTNLPKHGNLALRQTTSTSNSEAKRPSKYAVDGNTSTDWGSGDFPPQWIEIDLGAPATITEIRLLVTQSPNGNTIHRILARAVDGEFSEIHRFDQYTRSGQWLDNKFEQPLENIQIVRIETLESPSWVGWVEIEVVGER